MEHKDLIAFLKRRGITIEDGAVVTWDDAEEPIRIQVDGDIEVERTPIIEGVGLVEERGRALAERLFNVAYSGTPTFRYFESEIKKEMLAFLRVLMQKGG